MKKLGLLSLIAFSIVLLTFTSCDKAEELADITFDATLSTDINATSVSETRGDSYSFSGSAIVDPTSDPDIKEYWDNIKNFEVKKITVKVKEIAEETNLLEGHLLVNDNNTQEELYTAAAEALPLTPGTVILTVTEGDWGKITNALNNKHALFTAVEGAIDKPGIDIKFEVIIDLKVTANPL
jgi:hypothetical protein